MAKLSKRKENCGKVEVDGKMKHLSKQKHIDYLAHAAARHIVSSSMLIGVNKSATILDLTETRRAEEQRRNTKLYEKILESVKHIK